MDSSGQPSASAIGRGMAMTSGVSMNGVPAGARTCPARSFTIAAQPGRGGRPDHRRLAVDLGIGPPVDDEVGRVARRHAARADEHAPVTDRGLVAVVEVLGELGQQGDLLAAHRHVDDDAVAWVGAGEVARVRFGAVVVVATGARGDQHRGGCGGDDPSNWAGFFATSGTIPAQMPGWHDSRPDGGAHWISSHSCRRAIIVVADGSGVVAAAGGVPAGGAECVGGVLRQIVRDVRPRWRRQHRLQPHGRLRVAGRQFFGGCTQRGDLGVVGRGDVDRAGRGRSSWRRAFPRSGCRGAPPGPAPEPTGGTAGRRPTSLLLSSAVPKYPATADGERRQRRRRIPGVADTRLDPTR